MSNPIQDPVLGEIYVYREYKPRDDTIEYTTYFWRDGVKMRNDRTVRSAELEQFVETSQIEDYISNLIRADIAAGNYGNAETYIKGENMRETTRDEKFPNDPKEVTGETTGAVSGTTDSEKIIITLLMRLYDLHYAQLYILNPTVAEEVFESHEKGELGNPKMWIPEFGEQK